MGLGPYFCIRTLEGDSISSAFAKNAPAVTDALIRMAKTSEHSLQMLSNGKIAEMFVKDPQAIVKISEDVVKAMGGRNPYSAFLTLSRGSISDAFASNPGPILDAFTEVTKLPGDKFWAFAFLEKEDVSAAFAKDPQKIVKALREASSISGAAFSCLSSDSYLQRRFLALAENEISASQFSVSLFASFYIAIELGRPLDDLHFQDAKRKGYLDLLSQEKITGLVLSDPGFFYTSTNHMLLDRLLAICKEKNTSVTGHLKSYGIDIDSELGRNLIFRAINYDRLYEKQNSGIFTKDEMKAVIPALLAPMVRNEFDQTYFYLLANSMDKISSAGYLPDLLESLKGQAGKGDDKKARAVAFLVDCIENPERVKDLSFNRKNYLDKPSEKGGKLLIVQVFDKEDTEKDHWGMTQAWASKYGKPKKGASGEFIYENASTKIVLFMGDGPDANREFISSMLEKNKNMVLAFRGHSYSLDESFPATTFANHDGNILFIPGSCGSSGSIPAYISNSPKTKFAFFSNTSTGRGQVTNYGILDGLIEAKAPATYRSILNARRKIIEANEGDINTIQTPDLLGAALMAHIYSER